MHYSEVVDGDELESALREREAWKGVWPSVRVIAIRNGKIMSDRTFGAANDLKLFLARYHKVPDKGRRETNRIKQNDECKSTFRLFLLETLQVKFSAENGTDTEIIAAAVNPAMLRCLQEHAGLSDMFIAATCGLGHWYSVKYMHSETECDGKPKFEMFYEYVPQQGTHSCTQLLTDFETTTYFSLNLPQSVLARFTRDIGNDGELSSHLFYLDILTADEAMRTWQKDIALRRSELKSLDTTVDRSRINNDSIYELHALARQWHTMSRNLSDHNGLLRFLKSVSLRYCMFEEVTARLGAIESAQRVARINSALEYLSSSCQSLMDLVSDYGGRTQTRIDLLYHLANQAESQSTRELAELARQDSAAMITIAAVTLIFLPGTFVASILSTTIFDFTGTSMRIYGKWWIFPIVVIPFTALVFGCWLAWFRWKLQRNGSEINLNFKRA